MNIVYYKNRLAQVCLLFGLLSLLFSCEKETLDLKPADRITEVSAFESADRCELSIAGVYALAQSGSYPMAPGTYRGYPFGAGSILQSDMRGEDMVATSVYFQNTYESIFTAAASSGNNDAMWQNSFTAINGANLAIAGVGRAATSGIISQEMADQYTAECRFLRALTYHNLLIHFARPFADPGNNQYGLPYYKAPVSTSEGMALAMNQGRNSLDDCYKWILEDLDYAEANLPTTRGEHQLTRATMGAAIALKSRVKLHVGDWAGAREEGAKLVPAALVSPIGNYSLTADPVTPFNSYSSNTESIFSIEINSERSSINGALNVLLSSPTLTARGEAAISPIIYNNRFWLENDKRRGMIMKDTRGVYFTSKYSMNISTRDSWAPIIRYAEVILNYAEAIIRDGGNVSDALPYLNAVRNRSLLNPSDDAYKLSDFADKKAFMQALLMERRIEFLAEGRRWEDIHRLSFDPDFSTGGVPAKVSFTNMAELPAYGYAINSPVAENAFFGKTSSPTGEKTSFIPYSDRRFVWPIPESSTTRNELLKSQQNEGW